MGWEGETGGGSERRPWEEEGDGAEVEIRQNGEGTSRAQFRRERGLASACVSCGVLEVGVCHRRQERM